MPKSRINPDFSALQVTCEGRPLYTKPAIDGVRRRLERIAIQENTAYLICSPLLSIGVHELAGRLPANSTIIAIELDNEIDQSIGLKGIDQSTTYFGPKDINSFHDFINGAIKNGIKRSILVSLNGGYRLHKQGYDCLHAEVLRKLRNHLQNQATEMHLGRLWIKNSIENILLAVNSPLRTASSPKKMPCVILGAGTSSNEILPWLSQIAKYAVIVAVDTILPALMAYNITPDAVIALESQFANVLDFVPGIPKNCRYILDTSSYPGLARILPLDQISWVHTRFADLTMLNRAYPADKITNINPLGSVGPTTLQIAGMLFSGPFLLAGLDFAYLHDQTHAHNTAPDLFERLRQNRFSRSLWYQRAAARDPKKTKSRDGSTVYTDLVLEKYQLVLKNQLSHAFADRKCFSIAGKGLPLGIPCCNPADFFSLISIEDGSSKLPGPGTNERANNIWDFSSTVTPGTEVQTASKKSLFQIKEFIENELAVLETAIKAIKDGSPLPAEVDYVTFGLPANPSQQKIDIMLRYYADRWRLLATRI